MSPTPGPWRNACGVIVDASGNGICQIYCGEELEPFDNAEGNALLLAAAPDLLKAAKQIYEWWKSYPGATGAPAAMFSLTAAIAKAEGTAPGRAEQSGGDPPNAMNG